MNIFERILNFICLILKEHSLTSEDMQEIFDKMLKILLVDEDIYPLWKVLKKQMYVLFPMNIKFL